MDKQLMIYLDLDRGGKNVILTKNDEVIKDINI
jgi:hypothetical protein